MRKSRMLFLVPVAILAAIAGAGNWGIDGDDRGRVAWARFGR